MVNLDKSNYHTFFCLSRKLINKKIEIIIISFDVILNKIIYGGKEYEY